MDADVYGPSIPHLVGASGRPMARGERIQPIEAGGLKLMSMGFLLEPERAVIMRGPMLHGIMQQFLRQVDWGPLDYLVIDLPPGTGDVPLTLAQSAAADRRRRRLHAAGGRPARRHPRHHHVPPAEGARAGHDREHEPSSTSVAYLRDRGGPKAHKLIDAQELLRHARRRAGLHLRPRRRPAQGRASWASRSSARSP